MDSGPKLGPMRLFPSALSPLSRIVCALVLITALVAMGSIAAPSQAATKEKKEKVYVTPSELSDGSKPPAPPATSWLVGDLDSGELHEASGIDKRHAPASTIKLLTALALVEVLDDPEQKVEAEFEDMEIDGTKVGLVQKNKYSVNDLFHALLMSSANDAANALGRAAGGQDKAVELMNAKAAELGMTNTLATDTSGLDDVNQYTTAADLAKLAYAVCEDDYLMKVIGTEDYKFPGGTNPETKEKFKGYPIQNHTKIVGQVDGGLGLKNGFTRKAKGAYVAVAERDGKRVVSTLLGADNSSRQIAVDLLEWDFAQKNPDIADTIAVAPEPTPTIEAPKTSEPKTTAAARQGANDGSLANKAVSFASDNALPLGLFIGGVLLLLATIIIWVRLRKRAQED